MRRQHLDRHPLADLWLRRRVHDTHPPLAEQMTDLVLADERPWPQSCVRTFRRHRAPTRGSISSRPTASPSALLTYGGTVRAPERDCGSECLPHPGEEVAPIGPSKRSTPRMTFGVEAFACVAVDPASARGGLDPIRRVSYTRYVGSIRWRFIVSDARRVFRYVGIITAERSTSAVCERTPRMSGGRHLDPEGGRFATCTMPRCSFNDTFEPMDAADAAVKRRVQSIGRFNADSSRAAGSVRGAVRCSFRQWARGG